MMTLKVNGRDHQVDAEPDTPLLYVLRDDLQLNAAKFGCGLGQCGACTVIVDGKAVLSCVTPLLLLRGQAGDDAGRARHDRGAGADPARLHGRAGGAMRLLHRRHDDAGAGPAAEKFQADRRARSAPSSNRICAAAAPICGSCARCIAPPADADGATLRRPAGAPNERPCHSRSPPRARRRRRADRQLLACATPSRRIRTRRPRRPRRARPAA